MQLVRGVAAGVPAKPLTCLRGDDGDFLVFSFSKSEDAEAFCRALRWQEVAHEDDSEDKRATRRLRGLRRRSCAFLPIIGVPPAPGTSQIFFRGLSSVARA
jgi:hypothetical protein